MFGCLRVVGTTPAEILRQ